MESQKQKIVIILNNGKEFTKVASENFVNGLMKMLRSNDSPKFVSYQGDGSYLSVRIRDISAVEVYSLDEKEGQ